MTDSEVRVPQKSAELSALFYVFDGATVDVRATCQPTIDSDGHIAAAYVGPPGKEIRFQAADDGDRKSVV